jgi:hypothetical protein
LSPLALVLRVVQFPQRRRVRLQNPLGTGLTTAESRAEQRQRPVRTAAGRRGVAERARGGGKQGVEKRDAGGSTREQQTEAKPQAQARTQEANASATEISTLAKTRVDAKRELERLSMQ